MQAVGDDTTLAGIQRLVAEAQSSRSRAQALADRFAAILFYVAAGAGVLTFVVWAALGRMDDAVRNSVSVLVIACPHALGLAIPLVIALSTAISARAGILVKDRLALERMRTIDTVLFDKTGTLTKGNHAVSDLAGPASSPATSCAWPPPSKPTPTPLPNRAQRRQPRHRHDPASIVSRRNRPRTTPNDVRNRPPRDPHPVAPTGHVLTGLVVGSCSVECV